MVRNDSHMRLTVEQAREVAERAMRAIGHDPEDARLIADHLIDCELRGVTYGGLARAVSIAERSLRTVSSSSRERDERTFRGRSRSGTSARSRSRVP